MAIEKVEFMHECFHKHLCMGTVRKREDKEKEKEGKQKRVKTERSKVGTKPKISQKPSYT